MSAYRSNGGTPVPVAEVRPNPECEGRLKLDDAQVRFYVKQMRIEFSVEPIKVVKMEDGSYVVQDGHHRLAASKQCSFTHIPAIIELPSVTAQ